VTVFPDEYVQAPRSWTEQADHNLIYFNEAKRGGHFAAWEQPQLFSEELRAAFSTLRRSSPLTTTPPGCGRSIGSTPA
jgi:hypothetical protein